MEELEERILMATDLEIFGTGFVAKAELSGYGPIRAVSVALYDIDDDGKDEIFVGTSKALDGTWNEIRPAGLIVLEDDNTIKWAATFPAFSGPDPDTGLTYTTSSIGSRPVFGDINGDGEIEIVVAVGGDIYAEIPGVVGQPGDLGGVYALDIYGNTLWFHQSLDAIGGSPQDGRPDGVYSTPALADMDGDGIKDVVYGGWDQRLHVLNGSTGEELPGWPLLLLDTIWSSPVVWDLDHDGSTEILIGADISANAQLGTQTGGIFHVVNSAGEQDILGFDQLLANPLETRLRGKFEEQTLWSSPVLGDWDDDGDPEIAYGTGNYLIGVGEYVRVWNYDGTDGYQLPTIGRTFATPAFADLDGNGTLELIATTLEGYVHAWDNTGTELFATQTYPFSASGMSIPIFSAPLAVDLDGDGALEIIYSQGAELVIVDATGNQLTTPDTREYVMTMFLASPAIGDIDGDGRLDIISGGNTPGHDSGIVLRFQYNNLTDNGVDYRYARRQFRESGAPRVRNFVTRFYEDCLGRAPDPDGLDNWVTDLKTGIRAGSSVAEGFIFSQEYFNRNRTDSEFLDDCYNAFFGREPDAPGKANWLAELTRGVSRRSVLNGFTYSLEFTNLAKRFGIIPYTQAHQQRYTVRLFVRRFYVEVLEREADEPGLTYWADGLIDGSLAGSQLAYNFIFSQEFLNRNTTDAEFVNTCYAAFFGRAADQDGYDGWMAALAGGETRLNVLAGFTGSQEFANLCDAYGIEAQNLDPIVNDGATFGAPVGLTVGGGPWGIASDDFNADGRPDLAVVNYGDDDVSILYGQSDGTFSGPTDYSVGSDPRSIVSGDFNADGRPDLAVANWNDDDISILYGQGDGTFAGRTDFSVGDAPMGIASGDFNADGRPDLAVANWNDDDVSILYGQADGTFAGRTDFAVWDSPAAITSGDFNADGRPDLAVANYGSAAVSILHGQADGTFADRQDYLVGNQPREIVTADFDADGRLDLAVVNFTDGDVSILYGQADGTFAGRTDFSVGASPMAIVAADLNGDGYPDFVVVNNADNDVSVLTGQGDGTFAGRTDFPVGISPMGIVYADFNGDFLPDLAVTNGGDGHVSILYQET